LVVQAIIFLPLMIAIGEDAIHFSFVLVEGLPNAANLRD
jgi:hypothetical protein